MACQNGIMRGKTIINYKEKTLIGAAAIIANGCHIQKVIRAKNFAIR
jgi:hypothetical protein